MKNVLFTGCVLALLATHGVSAADTAGGQDRHVRQGSSDTGDRPEFRKRYSKNRIEVGTGSGARANDGPEPGDEEQGTARGGSGKGTGHGQGSSSGGSVFDFLNTRTSGSNGNPSKDYGDSHGRPRYAAPEPGGFPELAIVGAGLALYVIRRKRSHVA